jgi:hypothetical protein
MKLRRTGPSAMRTCSRLLAPRVDIDVSYRISNSIVKIELLKYAASEKKEAYAHSDTIGIRFISR